MLGASQVMAQEEENYEVVLPEAAQKCVLPTAPDAIPPDATYDQLLAAKQGVTRATRTFAVFPGSGGVARLIERPDQRLGGESIAAVFRAAGAEIRQSWCGPCFGQGPDALSPGQRAITTFNRNWQNRMGIGGEGYLASPAVVAASALVGYMAPPSELGLEWQPELFAV